MSADIAEQEIAHEQEFVDRVYLQLDASAKQAEALAKEGYGRGRLGHEGGLVERDAMVFQAAKRLATLNAAHEGLVFGRIDLSDEDEGPRYIGRIGLRDENRDSMLVDWRAPAAAVFYQATAAEPSGVVRRRVLRCAGQKVVAVEDDLLDADSPAAESLPVVGEGALMAQLSRARDRSMHSIVATIQAEQDEAIRAPGKGVVLITGGPGTGKTVVALHRAAYLLYSDRRRYESGGVLVVGPSGVFMRYIERVLPSLGETAVALRSLGEVVDGIKGARHDDPAVADVKGAARMAELMRRVARQAVPGAPREFRVFYRDEYIHLTSRDLSGLRRQLLSQGKRNRQVSRVPQALLDVMWRRVQGERGRDRGRDQFQAEMLGNGDFLDFVLAWWPPLDATEVLRWLADPEVLARVGEGVLSQEDMALLTKSWAHVADPGPGTDRRRGPDWSVEDVPLLDELRYQLGDLPEPQDEEEDPLAHLVDEHTREVTTVADRDRPAGPRTATRIEDDTYAHVLVDEAQDLSPMQWRMVGRRGRTASWTVVGDPAQSSWPVPDEAARARDEAFGDKPRHEFHLSTNYRNSKEIYDFAAAYAARVGLDADLPNAVRSTGVDPEERRVDDLEAGVRATVRELAEAVEGTIGIVVAAARRTSAQAWLDSWDELGDDRLGGPDARIAVLTGLDTKGLEFDGIVVVEPSEIESESQTGRATVYVVYTRATQRMVTVSTA